MRRQTQVSLAKRKETACGAVGGGAVMGRRKRRRCVQLAKVANGRSDGVCFTFRFSLFQSSDTPGSIHIEQCPIKPFRITKNIPDPMTHHTNLSLGSRVPQLSQITQFNEHLPRAPFAVRSRKKNVIHTNDTTRTN